MNSTIPSTQTVANPEAHVPGKYRTTITRDGAHAGSWDRINPGDTLQAGVSATPGTYVATAQRLNAAGSPIGPAVTSAPLVIAPPATDPFEAPASVTLTLS